MTTKLRDVSTDEPEHVEPPATPQPWFMITALMIGPNGQHNAISTLTPASNLAEAKGSFIEQFLVEQGQRGLGLVQVHAVELSGLVITRAEADGGEGK